MTNEYALHLLSQLQIGASVDAKPIIPQYEFAQALGVAIKALEQQQDIHDTCKKCIEFSEFKQTSDDCIRRDDVDAYIAKLMSGYLYDEERTRLEEFSAYLWELPSVTPKGVTVTDFADKCRECGKQQTKMVELSVEETKRPKGRWMRKTKVDGVYDIAGVKTWGVKCQCDRCDFTTIVIEDFGYYKYCPNCGAEMEGGEDADSN